MTDAPKRIWTMEDYDGNAPRAGEWIDEQSECPDGAPEYIHASEPAALIREAEARGMERAAQIGGNAAVEVLLCHEPDAGPLKIQMTRQTIANPIRRAAKGEPT